MGNQSSISEKGFSSSLKKKTKNNEEFKKMWRMFQEAQKLRKAGEYKKCHDHLQKLNKFFSSKKNAFPSAQAQVQNELGRLFTSTKEYQKSIKFYENAIKYIGEIKQMDAGVQKALGEIYNNLGISMKNLQKFQKAIHYYNKALAIKVQLKDIKGEGKILANIASLCNEIGKYEKSVKYYEKALKIFRNFEDTTLYSLALKELNKVKREIENIELKEEREKEEEEEKKSSVTIIKGKGDEKIAEILKEKDKEKEKLGEELEKLKDERSCVVCLENPRSILFLPCKHLCVCAECKDSLDQCPLCRQKIEQKIETFL